MHLKRSERAKRAKATLGGAEASEEHVTLPISPYKILEFLSSAKFGLPALNTQVRTTHTIEVLGRRLVIYTALLLYGHGHGHEWAVKLTALRGHV